MEPSFRARGVQGRRRWGRSGVLAVAAMLAGCAEQRRSIDPVAWWHDLEGGPIAAQRPPPPDANLPYPKLGTVPPKPAPIDPAERASVYAGLAANRADATYEAAQDPLKAAPARTQSGLFAGAAPLPPPSADNAGAALDAKPAAPTPPAAPEAASVLQADAPIPDAVADTTPAPVLPDGPPPQPHLAGVVIPVTIPHLPPKAPPALAVVAPGLTEDEAAAIAIGFSPGSAVLPRDGQAALVGLAGRRGAHDIEVVGFGESDATDPAAQIDGVRLGIARARAVATALAGDGVPAANLRLDADAPGRGAAARLID